MKLYIIQLKDLKTGAYLTPMFVPHPGAAVRDLQEVINAPNTGAERPVWARHPADFDLYDAGTWDTDRGELTPYTPLEYRLNLSSLLNQ